MTWFRKDKIAEAQKRLMDYWKDGTSHLCMCPSSDGGFISCWLAQLDIWNRRDCVRLTLGFEPESYKADKHSLKNSGIYNRQFGGACELWPRGTTREDIIKSCEAKANGAVDYFFRNAGLLPSDKTLALIRGIEFLMRFSFNSYTLKE